MNEKERLIEKLKPAVNNADDNYGVPNTEQVANYLLENGVIVLHANVGAAIYYVELEINADKTDLEPKIHRTTVTDISIANNYTMYSTRCGKTFPHSLFGIGVFLTKEQAKKALKGGEGDG